MGHIEKNMCSKITAQDFEKRRAQKEIVKAFLANPDSFNDTTKLMSEAGDSEDGGVVINLDYSFSSLQKITSSAAPPAITEKKEWPQLQSQAFKNPIQEDLLTGLTSLEVAEPTMAWGTDASAKLFPDAPSTPATIDWSAPTIDHSTSMLANKDPNKDRFHPNAKGWNPEMFRVALTGKYQCPWNLCG